MITVFDYKNNFEYLLARLNPRISKRGVKIQFADCLQVTPGYISQILSGKLNLTLEQADLANSFLEHSIEEGNFFILLVSRDRAGTHSLKQHFTYQIDHIIKDRLRVSTHLEKKMELSDLSQSIYYSSWLYPAIHVAITIPAYRKVSELIKFFHISKIQLLSILNFLEKNGLIIKNGDQITPTQNWVRIERDSHFFNQTQKLWRELTIRSLDQLDNTSLHYSGVFSIDAKTAERVRKELMSIIKSSVTQFQAAKEEQLQVLCLDFFKIPEKC